VTDTSATGRTGGTSATGRTGGTSAGGADERWHLEDRRDFLLRSLDDADREHEAGDLSDDDYQVLRRRDEQQLADVERALAAVATSAASSRPAPGSVPGRPGLVPLVLDDEDDEDDGPARPPRRRRAWMAIVGVAALVAGAVLLVVHLTSPRLPGETATGSVHLNPSQKVQQLLDVAATRVQKGELTTALNVYKQVLSDTPRQPQALAEWGWLTWQAAHTAGNLTLAAQGRSAVAESVKLDPSFYAGRLYLGSILLAQHQPNQAVVQYKAFLGDHPPKQWVATGATYIARAFTEAHQAVPAQVEAQLKAQTKPAAG